MSTKVWFIRKVHNNVQIGKAKRILKECKKNNKIQTNQNIKSVQDRQQQEMILKWKFDLWQIIIQNDSKIVTMIDHRNTHPT